jgi:hypothetical protein
MIVGCVVASALLGFPAAADPAVVARPPVGLPGHRTPGATSRSRRVAQSHPDTAPGLGGSSGVRRAGPEIAADAAEASLGHAGHDPALASSPGDQEMDVSDPPRASAHRGRCGRADRASGPREPELGISENPGRVAHARPPRGSLDNPPRSPVVADTAGTGPGHRHDLAAVPARAGVDDVGLRLLPRGLPG